jgi:hypothetical protein
MKIMSIIRRAEDNNMPAVFVVGQVPLSANQEAGQEANGPEVSEIKFYETGFVSGKAYRGKCYAVYFKDSSVRRVIPAKYVLDLAVDTSAERPGDVVPKLPQ